MRLLALILLILLGLLQYRLWFSPGGVKDVRQLEAAKEQLIEENEQSRERNASLAAEVADLKRGLDAVEEKARTEMGMIKEDEVFYQIVEGGELDSELASEAASEDAPAFQPLPPPSSAPASQPAP